MNIIILLLLIIIIICNNCINNKEDFHILNSAYMNPYLQQPIINPYVQQPILFPIYSPYRRYYLINTQLPTNYPYYPSIFAPYYSQYDILNRDGIIYR